MFQKNGKTYVQIPHIVTRVYSLNYGSDMMCLSLNNLDVLGILVLHKCEFIVLVFSIITRHIRTTEIY